MDINRNNVIEKKREALEKHLMWLISQPIREFQEGYGVDITYIRIGMTDISNKDFKRHVVSEVKIHIL